MKTKTSRWTAQVNAIRAAIGAPGRMEPAPDPVDIGEALRAAATAQERRRVALAKIGLQLPL